jgi:hypothetical protein
MDLGSICQLLVLFWCCAMLDLFLSLLYLIKYSRSSGLYPDGCDLFFDLFEIWAGGGGDDIGRFLIGRG